MAECGVQILVAQTFSPAYIIFAQHRKDKNFIVEYASRDDYNFDPEEYEIVSSMNLSDFSPYFSFLDEEARSQAGSALIQLVSLVGQASITTACLNEQMPTRIKRAYRKAIRFFQKICDTPFVTELFIRKVGKVIVKIWNQIVRFRNFTAKGQRNHPILSTEFVC